MSEEALDRLTYEAAGHLLGGDPVAAGRLVADFLGLKTARILAPDDAKQTCFALLGHLLSRGRYDLGAQLLWGDNRFYSKPRFTKLVFDAWAGYDANLFMGSASTSKSFSSGAWLLLDWLRDPENTDVKLIGPSQQHLSDNLFSHLVTLHRGASLPLPGVIGDLFIGLDMRARKSSITGVVIPIGKKAAGRLQGAKRVPRTKPHPIFGKLSRMRVFIDEIENVQTSVWADIDNIFSNADRTGGFKIGGAFNPANRASPVAVRAEPANGWDNLDMDDDEVWTSARGWRVVRLDAMKCENVIEDKVIYQGLQTRHGVELITKNAGGVGSPGWYTMVRAMYPPQGQRLSVFSGIPPTAKVEVMFQDVPTPAAGIDVALTGRDSPKICIGRFGLAVGIRHPRNRLNAEPREEFFEDENGVRRPRYLLQVDDCFDLPRGDTLGLAKVVQEHCERFGVRPGWCAIDRTGNGAGVHDLLLNIWSGDVMGVNYSEGAGSSKILTEDKETPKEAYDRVGTELWFAASKWTQFGYLRFAPSMDTGELVQQLTDRLYLPGKKVKVEAKDDFKDRNQGKSPDAADALTLLVHAVRRASGCVPSSITPSASGSLDRMADRSKPKEPRIDCTNRFEDLD